MATDHTRLAMEVDPTTASITDFLKQWRTAWNDRDVNGILALTTEDIVWLDNTWPRPLRGRNNVRRFLKSFFGRMQVTFDVVGGPYFIPGEPRAALHWHAAGSSAGVRFESDGADFYELAGGALCRFRSITAGPGFEEGQRIP